MPPVSFMRWAVIMFGFCLFVCAKNCSCSQGYGVYTQFRLFNYVPAKVVRHL